MCWLVGWLVGWVKGSIGEKGGEVRWRNRSVVEFIIF
jgi:hypothetical protein